MRRDVKYYSEALHSGESVVIPVNETLSSERLSIRPSWQMQYKLNCVKRMIIAFIIY